MNQQAFSSTDAVSAFFNGDELRKTTWLSKYALRSREGALLESHPSETFNRVATVIAAIEKEEERGYWRDVFYDSVSSFKFIPGGRIMFGAGSDRKVTVLQCYYIPLKEDSIEGIFDCAKEMALTYKAGGGCGIDVSTLRPQGANVSNSAITSTGAVSFMPLYDLTTGIIGQHGRRGALMITMSVEHPDILEFVHSKKDGVSISKANISVKITDGFMGAVINKELFKLSYGSFEKHVDASSLFHEIASSAWECADPGLLFWDTCVRESPTEYDDRMAIKGQNPCAEQMLEDYGCCNLGSINLSQFVLNPFRDSGNINFSSLTHYVKGGIRFLDNVLTYNQEKHPLPQQAECSRLSRRIGLGFTGLADMLVKLRLKYDSVEALLFVDRLFQEIKNVAYEYDTELAVERGVFPLFDAEKHLERPFIKRLSSEVRDHIKERGLRNSCLLTFPPVGSGHIIVGASNGIEPIFDFNYVRRTPNFVQPEFKVVHPLVREYMEIGGLKHTNELPEYFVAAHQIDPFMRVRMQATIQKHIDSAISSTINLPRESTVEQVEQIYMEAYLQGCKGITIYRAGSKNGEILSNQVECKNGACGI